MIRTVGIVGLGALGMLYADHFSKHMAEKDIKIIVNKERKERYESRPLTINGKETNFNYVLEDGADAAVDLILFCVKGNQLADSLETAKHYIGPQTTILSFLNGISSEEEIAKRYPASQIIHCVAQGMDAVREEQNLFYERKGELRIGIDDLAKQSRLADLEAFFQKTAFPYTIETDIVHRIWKKFMLNVGVNQVVMLTEGVYADAQEDGETRDLMIAAMKEVIQLAQAEGIHLNDTDLEDNLKLLATLSPKNMPSMRQDGLAKRPSEVELFAGTVIEKAKKHQLAVPTNMYLYGKIKEIESHYSL